MLMHIQMYPMAQQFQWGVQHLEGVGICQDHQQVARGGRSQSRVGDQELPHHPTQALK